MSKELSDIYVFSKRFPTELRTELQEKFAQNSSELLDLAQENQVEEVFFYIDPLQYLTDGDNSAPVASVKVYHEQEVTNADSSGFVDQIEIILEEGEGKRYTLPTTQVFYPASAAEMDPQNAMGG